MFIAQTNFPAVDRRAAVTTMSSHRERSRPLLVFSPTSDDQRLQMQIRLLSKGYSELHERQVVFVPLVMKGRVETVEKYPMDGCVRLKSEEAATTRKRLHISPEEFTVVLLGKDGGEKFRSHAPVTIEKLDALIDAMPMRQREVQNGHAK